MTRPLLFPLFTLACYRITRIVTRDDLPWLASIRTRTYEAVQRRHGLEWADGLTCAWCAGWWVTAVATAWLDYLVGVPIPVLWWLATATTVGLIGARLDG